MKRNLKVTTRLGNHYYVKWEMKRNLKEFITRLANHYHVNWEIDEEIGLLIKTNDKDAIEALAEDADDLYLTMEQVIINNKHYVKITE